MLAAVRRRVCRRQQGLGFEDGRCFCGDLEVVQWDWLGRCWPVLGVSCGPGRRLALTDLLEPLVGPACLALGVVLWGSLAGLVLEAWESKLVDRGQPQGALLGGGTTRVKNPKRSSCGTTRRTVRSLRPASRASVACGGNAAPASSIWTARAASVPCADAGGQSPRPILGARIRPKG